MGREVSTTSERSTGSSSSSSSSYGMQQMTDSSTGSGGKRPSGRRHRHRSAVETVGNCVGSSASSDRRDSAPSRNSSGGSGSSLVALITNFDWHLLNRRSVSLDMDSTETGLLSSTGSGLDINDDVAANDNDLFLCSAEFEDFPMDEESSNTEERESFEIRLPRVRPSRRGPSRFISRKELVSLHDEAETSAADHNVDIKKTHSLFHDHFHQWNRVDNMAQVMGYHPDYLERFMKLHNHLLNGNGPLPRPYRHYLAIMAASRHQCAYLVHIHATQFLLEDGDTEWLKGLDHAPQKLRDLSTLNKLLAHQPWLLTREHVEALGPSFSLSELGHALALLCHFHALSGFVHACGVNPELDSPDGFTYRTPSAESGAGGLDTPMSNGHLSASGSAPGSPGSRGDQTLVFELMEKMRHLDEDPNLDPEELVRRYQTVESQNVEITVAADRPAEVKEELHRFVDEPEFCYIDFMTNKRTPTFRLQHQHSQNDEDTDSEMDTEDTLSCNGSISAASCCSSCTQEFCALSTADYPWEDAASLANMLFGELGDLIDDKIKTTYELTYRTCGNNEDVDTSAFRRSIWNYIHVLYGIFHDDYNYADVNNLLDRPLKTYVKTVACYPERVCKRDYDSFMQGFKHSEKVHVNLMILEARLQAELLYVFRAIQRRNT